MPLQTTTFARLPWFFGAIFATIGLCVVVPGWWFIAVQHHRLATYLPVEARITESRVIRSGKDTYKPVIGYSYSVNGHRYEGRRVCAIGNYSASGTWAGDIASQFPAGADATAWYSARDPGSSFLSRDVVFIPHFVAIFGLVFFLAGAWCLLQSFQGRRVVAPPVRGRDGWFKLAQETSNRQAFRMFFAVTLIWYGYIAVAFGDYLVLSKFQFNIVGVIGAGIAAGLGLIVLVQCWRYWKLQHDFMDAQLSTDRERFQLGSPVRLRLEQGVCRHLLIGELSLGAVCMRNDRITSGTSVNYPPASESCNVHKRLAVNREYVPGSQLSAVCEFKLPEGAEPSTPPVSSIFPIYQWFIVLQVAAQDQPVLHVRFPIAVENGSRAASVMVKS